MATFKDKVRSLDSLRVAATGNNGQDAIDSIIISPVANTAAADIVTITNAAFGQATTLTIPDPATASASFVLSSGTYSPNLTQVAVTLTPAQVIASYATPIVLVAAPGATKMLRVSAANVYTASTGHTAFTTGVGPIIQYSTGVTTNGAHGAGTIATGAGLVEGDITAAASQVRTLGPAASAVYTATSNLALTFSCTTAFAAGTGTNVTITLVYETLTATV